MVYSFFQFGVLKQIHNALYINSTALASFGFLVISLLFFPEVLYGMPRQDKIKRNKIKKKSKNTTQKNVVENEMDNSKDVDPFLELFEKIKIYLDNEKPYLNPNFSIAQISTDLGVPQNHVSYCINTLFNTKFSKLKTKLRVEQTKIYLNESQHSKITIDGIAQMVGFSSRSSFYGAFKEETGMTPSEYLKIIEEENNMPPTAF